MAANTNPIFTETPVITWGPAALATQNTAMDGTGTVVTVFTASADGGFVKCIRARAAGTNIATVLRVFVNNGSSNATPANNILIDELTLPATTASANSALASYELILNLALPPAYVLNVTIGTTVASGYYVSAIGGSY